MTTSPKPRKCMYCRENQVVPTVLPSHVEEMEHDGRKYSVCLVHLSARLSGRGRRTSPLTISEPQPWQARRGRSIGERPPRLAELETRRRVYEILSPSSWPGRTLPPRPAAGLGMV